MPSLIEEFDSLRGLHEDFCKQLEVLLSQLLKARGIAIHSISSRTKDRASFEKKIAKKGQNYNCLAEITDLVGIRVITYFADQVDDVAKLVEKEFFIDRTNSVDKRASLDPDRFGYLSVHYIASLPEARCALTENKPFSGLKAEIQIRSILQHAWAEIEHDLGYKTKGEVPSIIRRQFARLAGLLELGDGEFIRIRNDLDHYEKSVSQQIAEEPESVPLDKITLIDFAKTELLVAELDASIAAALGCKISKDYGLDGDIEKLDYFNIKTVAELKDALFKFKGKIIELANKWGAQEDDSLPGGLVTNGISIFYLCHILAGSKQDLGRAEEYYRRFGFGPESSEILAQEIIDFMGEHPHNQRG